VVTPDGKSLPLPPPEYKRMGPDPLGKTLTVEKGDLGIRKLQFNKDAAQGTYNAVAVSAPSFFTQYVDSKGKKKMSMKPLDQIKDAKQVLFACKYTSYAKAPIVYKKWTEAKPLGHDLEIVPMVDTSKLRAGDLLPVQAFFMGKPLAIKGTDMAFVTASSKTFGGPDHFSLMSYLMGGKAQFRIPAAGQWLLSVMITRDVDKDPALADLKGKTHTVIYMATLNVNVNP
jgi:uncharacterized GH25 family protein